MSETAVSEPSEPPRSPSDLPPILAWIGALEATPAGRLMLTNLLHAFRTSRLPPDLFRAVLGDFARAWACATARRPDTIVEHVADQAPTKYTCQPPSIDPAWRCSRVVDDVTFVTYNIDHRELPYEFVDYVPTELLEQLEEGLPTELLGDETNTLRSSRPFAWVTRTEMVEELRARYPDANELATALRDRLGLAHYWADHQLIEIEYPTTTAGELRLAAPTFIDGGAGVLFRARKTSDGWGRAVDLQTHDDGLPEAVHPPVRLTAEFRVRRVGRVLRGSEFAHLKVIERAEHPWSAMPADFLAFLLGSSQCEPNAT